MISGAKIKENVVYKDILPNMYSSENIFHILIFNVTRKKDIANTARQIHMIQIENSSTLK
jgi:hypothetical protein